MGIAGLNRALAGQAWLTRPITVLAPSGRGVPPPPRGAGLTAGLGGGEGGGASLQRGSARDPA